MHIAPALLIHICCAAVGLLSGFLAMAFRKGSGLHRAAGDVFFISMLGMGSSGAYIAAFLRPNLLNLGMGLFTFYLVSTGWWSARHKGGTTSFFDVGALLLLLVVAAIWIPSGFAAAASATGTKDGMPAPMYFVFGSIALLHGVSDIRMLVRGGVTGARRIARHLWRMCFPLWIATLSLYPGQAKLFSRAIRDTNLMFVPHVVLIGATLFWLVRVRGQRRSQRIVVGAQEEELVRRVA